MGADGNITIMDAEKFIQDKGLSEARFQSFFQLIEGSTTYLQKFKGQRVITDYNGDGLYCVSVLRELSWYGFDKDQWDGDTYDYLIGQLAKYEFTVEEFIDLADHLWENCYIDVWEVWT